MFLSVAVLRCNGTGEPPREPGRLPGLRFVSGHFLWLANASSIDRVKWLRMDVKWVEIDI